MWVGKLIINMKNHRTIIKILAVVFFASLQLLVSCKKESQESFGTPQTTTESTDEGMVAETKSPEALGKEIFEGKGNCVACHQVDKKVIGPSIEEIAKIYHEQKGDIVAFLFKDAKPIVDPSQYEVMKTNFAITKAMSNDELMALEAYIQLNLK